MNGTDLALSARSAVEVFFGTFSDVTAIGLILPDGWFGKPYDEIFTFEEVRISTTGRIEVDLGWGRVFSLLPEAVYISPNRCELNLEGTELLMTSGSHSKMYRFGIGKFIVSDYYESVQSVAATAAGQLEPWIRR